MTEIVLTPEVEKSYDALVTYFKSLKITTEEIQDKRLFLSTFVHKSYAADFKEEYSDNERLEFVGDSVLWAIITKALFNSFPEMPESEMTLYKIALVREETLAKVAKKIWLNQQIFISRGEEKNHGREKHSIISDALEACIGYIFIDFGFAVAENFVIKFVYSEIENIKKGPIKSYKTLVQETIQKIHKVLPIYKDFENTKDERGNVLTYSSKIYINDVVFSVGIGTSKKKAQEAAAKDFYLKHKEENL